MKNLTTSFAKTIAPMLSLSLTLFVGTTALAQSPASGSASTSPAAPVADDQPQTVFGGPTGGSTQITGWFLAPTFTTTGFGGTLAYSPGLRGGIYLNRRFAIGLAANAITTNDSFIGKHELRNLGSYGGLLLQYQMQSNRLLHTSVEATIGTGTWCAHTTYDDEQGCTGKDFLAFEPVANVELNLSKHIRLTSGVGYRFAIAGSGTGPSSRDMSSLVARSAIVFGSF